MPRPSLKTERTEQIFSAFLRCVARYGVDGASLERIAEEAGLQRSMIRHFVGNRDALVNGLAERLSKQFSEQTEVMIRGLPDTKPATTLIELLFNPAYASSADSVLALEALIAAAPRFPKVRKQLLSWYADIAEQFTYITIREFPKASQSDCRDVAIGIIGIYFNTDALEPLALDSAYRDSGRRAALLLLNALHQKRSIKSK